MNIHTINTLKAKELNGQKKGKLKIAGCEAVAQSYGVYIYGDTATVELSFSYTLNKWVVGVLNSPDDLRDKLPKDVSNDVMIKAIKKFLKETKQWLPK